MTSIASLTTFNINFEVTHVPFCYGTYFPYNGYEDIHNQQPMEFEGKYWTQNIKNTFISWPRVTFSQCFTRSSICCQSFRSQVLLSLANLRHGSGGSIVRSSERNLVRYSTVPLRLNKGNFMQYMTIFHLSLVGIIHAATLLPTRYVLTINETFQMRYCMKFYLKGHQKYKQSNFWLSKFT